MAMDAKNSISSKMLPEHQWHPQKTRKGNFETRVISKGVLSSKSSDFF